MHIHLYALQSSGHHLEEVKLSVNFWQPSMCKKLVQAMVGRSLCVEATITTLFFLPLLLFSNKASVEDMTKKFRTH